MIDPQYPKLEQIAKRRWKLLEPIVWEAHPSEGRVPPAFETDGASVPRIFWNICPPMSNYTNAAVVHDYLYVTKPEGMARKEADRVFLELMTELGVAGWRRRVMHRAVRLFGPRW